MRVPADTPFTTSLVALLALSLATVAIAAPAPDGRGTGGIPAVLGELDELRAAVDGNRAALARIEANQAALSMRLGALDDHLSLVGDDVGATLDQVTPCTPERWRAGECDVLGVEASVCFTLALGAELGASYAIDSGLTVEAGVGWPNVADAKLAGELGLPGLALVSVGPSVPPAVVVVPGVQAGASTSVGGTVELCLANLTLPVGDGAAEDFVRDLVDALEGGGAEVVDVATNLARGRGLSPARFRNALAAMGEVRGGRLEADDPLEIFQGGPLGELAAALPVDPDLAELFANPHDLVLPDGLEPFALCTQLNDDPDFMGDLGDRFEEVCTYVVAQPDLVSLSEAIERMPTDVADEICDLIPNICDDGRADLRTRRECRQSCRRDARACKNDCGLFDFPCRRDCEADKDECIADCP